MEDLGFEERMEDLGFEEMRESKDWKNVCLPFRFPVRRLQHLPDARDGVRIRRRELR